MNPGTILKNRWQANHLVSKGIRVQSRYSPFGELVKGMWSDYFPYPCVIGYSHRNQCEYRVFLEENNRYCYYGTTFTCDYAKIQSRIETFLDSGRMPFSDEV